MIRELIELVAQGIEVMAVVVILGGIIYGFGRCFFRHSQQVGDVYKRFKHSIGKSLLLGLELLVAADVIRTVALDLTLRNIATLAALVVVRTFLGWTLAVEVEGRWPWQKREEVGRGTKEGISTTLPQGTTAIAAATGAKTERRE